MIFRVPSYYDDFHCIADKCKDNCCIGWEIDIDDITLEKYLSVGGSFGERLRSSISTENPSFIPDKSGRCPFLNKDNLCDIILDLGENYLCDICNNHPRYFEWFGDVKEGGIGLSCIEGARIILSEKFSLIEKDIPDEETDYPDDEELFRFLLDARDKIISHLSDENIPLSDAVSDIIEYGYILEDCLFDGDFTPRKIEKSEEKFSPDMRKTLTFLTTLEQLSPEWSPFIKSAEKGFSGEDFFIPETEFYLRNTAVYFIWRYFLKSVYDGEISHKTNLMATSVFILSYLFFHKGDFSPEALSEIAKNFSKEIEYSEENLEELGYFKG